MSWLARLWPRARVRFIPQLELAECGAASLAMVLDYHGCAVPLVEARGACEVSRDGVSALRILRAARAYGLAGQGFKLEPVQLAQLPLPAILHWELNHFVVLERASKRGAVLVDPAYGRRFVTARALAESFTGVVLAFTPTDRLARRPHQSRSLGRYLAVLCGQRRALGYVALSALLLQLLGLLLSTSTQVVIDHVVRAQRATWLVPVAAALLGGVMVRHLLEWLRARVLVSLQTALDLTLSEALVGHLMRLPLGFFAQRATGDLMRRVDDDGALRAITARIALSGLDALLLVAHAALMLAYDARLGGLTLLLSCARVLALTRVRRRMRQEAERLEALAGREQSTLVEALSAPETVRALGAEAMLVARHAHRAGARVEAELRLKRTRATLAAWVLGLDGLATALVLWVGGGRVIAGAMSVGVFAGFLVLQRLLDAPLAGLVAAAEGYQIAQAMLGRVDDVLETPPAAVGRDVLPTLRGTLALEAVSFRHAPSAPAVLSSLSLTIAKGEKVALVGRSGQGKTTLMQLLLGMLEPCEGRILIDGVPRARLDREALAAHLGAVPQEPFLLHDTLATNLRLRVPDATDAELLEALRVAALDEWLASLPRGLATMVAPHALSGGQRQRVAIARAVVRRPAVLLLDEATSALDPATEARVHANLGALGCTRVLIAHRLATVRDADRILVLDGGKVVQAGDYAQLSAAPGPFRALVAGRAC